MAAEGQYHKNCVVAECLGYLGSQSSQKLFDQSHQGWGQHHHVEAALDYSHSGAVATFHILAGPVFC